MPTWLTIFYRFIDDAIPIDGNMTLGNHLEKDLMIPGEDVSDYHAPLIVGTWAV